MTRRRKERTQDEEKRAEAAGKVMAALMEAHRDSSCSMHSRWVWANKIKAKLAQRQTVAELLDQIADAKTKNGGAVDGLCHWQVFPPMPISELRKRRRNEATHRLEDEHAALKDHMGKRLPRDEAPAGPREPSKLQIILRQIRHRAPAIEVAVEIEADIQRLLRAYQAGEIDCLEAEAKALVCRHNMRTDMGQWIEAAIREQREEVRQVGTSISDAAAGAIRRLTVGGPQDNRRAEEHAEPLPGGRAGDAERASS